MWFTFPMDLFRSLAANLHTLGIDSLGDLGRQLLFVLAGFAVKLLVTPTILIPAAILIRIQVRVLRSAARHA